MPLTDIAIKNIKPELKAKKYSDERGLFLLVNPNGSKYWRFKYRIGGKEKLLALGVYPDVTLAKARQKRDEARKLVADGIDASLNKQQLKQAKYASIANSFEVIAREWIQTFFISKSESHKQKTLRRLEAYLFPWIGNKPISEITAPDVLMAVKRPQRLNKLETAHRALQVTGQIFRYAVQTGRAVRDVTADLKGALPPTDVKHMASFTDPNEVAKLLRAMDAFKGSLTVECALKLAPLVFVRPGELRRAKWKDIDLEKAEWRYLVTKTKTEHIVPLSTQAINLLKEMYPVSGHGEYVFPGGHDPKKAMSDAAINAALKRIGYDTQSDITGHGFRAMARTILHERLSIDPYIIEHQLAHAVPDALGSAYNRTKFLDQRKQMMQVWADYLDKLKSGAVILDIKGAA